jgi:hypothetical protein
VLLLLWVLLLQRRVWPATPAAGLVLVVRVAAAR